MKTTFTTTQIVLHRPERVVPNWSQVSGRFCSHPTDCPASVTLLNRDVLTSSDVANLPSGCKRESSCAARLLRILIAGLCCACPPSLPPSVREHHPSRRWQPFRITECPVCPKLNQTKFRCSRQPNAGTQRHRRGGYRPLRSRPPPRTEQAYLRDRRKQIHRHACENSPYCY
jgi:hypothetical protein